MGHEGVARVIKVGAKVKKKKNDYVVTSWIKGDGNEKVEQNIFPKIWINKCRSD